MKNRLLGILLPFALLFALFCPPVLAEESDTRTDDSAEENLISNYLPEVQAENDFIIPLFYEPQSLTLPHNNTSFWFLIPDGTEVAYARIVLVLDSTDTLLSDYSTATIKLNNVEIASIGLIDLKENYGNIWVLDVPVSRLKTDGTLNQLDIITAQRSILGDCADVDNPSNWITILEDSGLLLGVNSFGPYNVSDLFQYYFNRVDVLDRLECEWVVPDIDAIAEIATAWSVASEAGNRFPYKSELDFPFSYGNARNISTNQIQIGMTNKVTEGNGFISVNRQDGTNIAYIMGNGEEGLQKALNVLRKQDYLSQLSQQEYEISTNLSDSNPEFNSHSDGTYTLSDFGYDDINLAGAFHQQTSFTIKQPDAVAGGTGSYVDIHFRHSDALVGDTSLLTVFFNNVAADSVQLSSGNAKGGNLKVKIPEEVLKYDTVNITVDVYNYLGKIDCSKDWYDVAWTVIDNDSEIYFEPGDYSTIPTLEHFPSFHSTTSSKEHYVQIIASEALSDTMIESMAYFAARAGQNSTGSPLYRFENEYNRDFDGDLVYAGPMNSISLPDDICSLLYLKPESASYEISPEIHTMNEALASQVIIQVVRSPYNYSRKVYVITYPDNSYEVTVREILKDKKILNQISGVAAAVSKSGKVSVLESVDTAERKVPMSADRVINKVSRFTGISRVGLLAVLILVIVIVILLIRSSRIKNRFSNAKKQMEDKNSAQTPGQSEEEEEDFEHDDR